MGFSDELKISYFREKFLRIMWFRNLMGFDEINPSQVQENIAIDGEVMTSLVNGKSYQHGVLEVPTLKELKKRIDLSVFDGSIKITEIVGNVRALHCLKENENAMFQAASQFNMLEMISPSVTPEMGVDGYENDHTQGPACAIACGAGTIYRNYFALINGKKGQTSGNQIDGLEEIGKFFGNTKSVLWKMQNGYCFPTETGLKTISESIRKMKTEDYESLKSLLKTGIQWNTEVTNCAQRHLVSQIYCSALPIGYSSIYSGDWKEFASLVLDATYESAFYAATENYQKTGCSILYLTLVGGGVFQNELSWILSAIKSSLEKFKNVPLDVRMVSYGKSDPVIADFVKGFRG